MLRFSLRHHRHFLAALAWRSLLGGRLGQSGGLFWVIVHPLITLAVYLTVFLTLFRSRLEIAGGVREDYEVFVLSGFIPWMLISEVLVRAITALRDGASFVRHGAGVPLELIPIGTLLAQLIPFLLQMVLLVGWVAATAGLPPIAWLLLLGAFVITAVGLAGLALLLAVLGLLWRNASELVRIYGVVGSFICPIFYTGKQMPSMFQLVMDLNPATHVINLYRDALFFRQVTAGESWVLATVFAVMALALGYRSFIRNVPGCAGRL